MDKPNQTRNNAFLRVKKFLDDYHDILLSAAYVSQI